MIEMELPTYHFDTYTLRPATMLDALLAMEWTAADPFHAWEAAQPDYWIEQKFGINTYVVEDVYGPVFFFKMVRVTNPCSNCGEFLPLQQWGDVVRHNCIVGVHVGPTGPTPEEMRKIIELGWAPNKSHAIEINLQFDVRHWIPATDRVMWALIAGMDWLAKALPMNGIDTVYFHSKSPRLIAFAEKRLGFVQDGERWKRVIAPVEAVANSIKDK